MANCVATVELPYLATLSVNRAYIKNTPRLGHKEEVDQWLTAFRCELNREIGRNLPVASDTRPRLDLVLLWRKKRGRIADADNFVKLPKDVTAAALGIDDWLIDQTSRTVVRDDIELEGDYLQYTLHWETVDMAKSEQEIPYSAKSMGPLAGKDWIAKLKLQHMQLCIGYGSAYCMICDALEYCPEMFDPQVYTDCPCRKCKIEICPCRGNDPGYEARKKRIEMWWQAKNK